MNIILIGGPFHRERMDVRDLQHTIRMALPTDLVPAKRSAFPELHEIKYEEYRKLGSIFGDCGVIPDNLFFHTSLDPVIFLKNLVLDYVK